jgi:hypothetical protein
VAGDQLDLSVISNGRPFIDQTVVLSQGTALVLFSVVSWLRPPDLSAYSLGLAVGVPNCAREFTLCGGNSELFSPLLVTRGADSARIQSGETKLVGDLSVSVQSISIKQGGHCDPPTSFRYGGFSLRR